MLRANTRNPLCGVFFLLISCPCYSLWPLAALVTLVGGTSEQAHNLCDPSNLAGVDRVNACRNCDVCELNAAVCSRSRQEAERLDPSGQIVSHDEPIWTKTDPGFSINVHPPSYDGERRFWGIVDTGLYYDMMLTRAAQVYLHGKPPGVVLDIGSNIGWLSLYAAAMGHEVFSFEPNPFNVVRQCQSLGRNAFSAPYRVLDLAVGDQEASGQSLAFSWNPVAATLLPAENVTNVWTRETISNNVTMMSIDAFVAREEAARGRSLSPILLLKVDVEGFEPMVIKGAMGTLRRRLVQAIYMEVSALMITKVSWRACIEVILKLGYRLVSMSYGTEMRPPEFIARFNEDHDVGLLLLKCASKRDRLCDLLWELKLN